MGWFEGKKIIVPIDFSEQSHRAVDEAIVMASNSSSHLFVVHAAAHPSTMAPEVIWQDMSDEMRRSKIETYFKQKFDDDRYRDISFEVVFGDPGLKIAEYAEEVGGDVIVMSSHGRTGVKRLLLGSVAERVLRFAHCPVLILRN